jgi:hypothetical protein
MYQCRFSFMASTGRTATMFVARTLDSLPGVVGLHEGHTPDEPSVPRLPLINLQNRQAWYETTIATQLVSALRDSATLARTAGDAAMLIDVAFYNAPLLVPLAKEYPDATLLAIFRRCEGFVRSATIVSGEDLQPAGWPDRDKPLTDREMFISLGRLQPKSGSRDAGRWNEWSAIQRNIWLWSTINRHMLEVVESHPRCHALLYEELAQDPRTFWTDALTYLDLLTDANLQNCVARSATKVNQRSDYQVGPATSWTEDERTLYQQLALPLERKIYD